LEVRRARPEEWPACADIYVRSGRAAFTWAYPAEFQAAKLLGWADEGEEIYLAHDGERVVAMMTFWRPDNFVHNLFVEPDVQGSGLGSALLALAEKIADGPISLKCDAQNLAAIAFYKRRGLTVCEEGQRPDGGVWFMLRRI
jgi:GNAT superfamily N-acetyltransferase